MESTENKLYVTYAYTYSVSYVCLSGNKEEEEEEGRSQLQFHLWEEAEQIENGIAAE